MTLLPSGAAPAIRGWVSALVAAALGLAAAPGVAHAAEPITSADALLLEQAKRNFLAGQELYAAGRYRDALESFLRSRELMPDAATAYNAALCYEHLGEIERAIASYKEYLRLGGEPADAPAIRSTIERLDAELSVRSGRHGIDIGHVERPFLGKPRWWAVVAVGTVLAAGFAITAVELWRTGRVPSNAYVETRSALTWKF